MHAHGILYSGVIIRSISAKYKIPYVITEHSSVYSRGLILVTQKQAAIDTVNDAAKLIAVSKEFCRLLDRFYDLPSGAWKYIPNIVGDTFLSSNQTRREHHTGFTFITVSLLTPNKATSCLLHAFSRVFSGIKSIRLQIGGDGSERQNLQDLARKLNIDTQVEFLGMLSRSEEHTPEIQSLMRISYAVFCLKIKKIKRE